jgi:hypothetical protein
MDKGESTDWWTSSFFWFLRLTSFDGRSIWLTSLVSIIVLYVALYYFVFSIPTSQDHQRRTLFFTCATPLFGNFAVNINHDVFFTAGVLILIAISMRVITNPNLELGYTFPVLAVISLLNSKTGYALIILFLLFILLIRKSYYQATVLGTTFVCLFFITGLGISKTEVPMHILPALADIKCVTQHPEARITESEWAYLSTIADVDAWKSPKICSSMDIAIGEIRNENLSSINEIDFVRNYLSISKKNPAIVIQAHLQRSSMALPPPFFQGPENQVDRNIQNPVGLNTNIALQLGPSVLHPSIDDERFKIDNSALKILESFVLFFSFIINQASWFWGWGGLWLWPTFIYIILTLRIRSFRNLMVLTYPLVATHLILFLVSPIPAPRYVMSSILTGFVFTVMLLLKLLEATNKEVK